MQETMPSGTALYMANLPHHLTTVTKPELDQKHGNKVLFRIQSAALILNNIANWRFISVKQEFSGHLWKKHYKPSKQNNILTQKITMADPKKKKQIKKVKNKK